MTGVGVRDWLLVKMSCDAICPPTNADFRESVPLTLRLTGNAAHPLVIGRPMELAHDRLLSGAT